MLLIAAAAATAGSATPIRVRVTFTGTAQERVQDVERWILLSENECYLRHSRDQEISATWSASWAGGAGKQPAATEHTATGTVAGRDVRDTCDSDEAPPEDPGDDIPDDWVRDVPCSDPLHLNGAATLTWGRGTLTVAAPKVSLQPDALCTAESHEDDWRATVKLDVSKLKRGQARSFRVGTRGTSSNCKHEAKPYEGYRSFDVCEDTLTWGGVVTVTRL